MATVYEYPKTFKRYNHFHKQDVITEEVAEAVTEGCLVARDLDAGTIVKYDPDGTVGDAVSGANEKPLGVVVYDSYAADAVANIAIRGTFGDIFAHVDDHIDTLVLDDDGGTAGGKKISWTLSHEPLPVNEILTQTVKVEYNDDGGATYEEIDADDYTVSTSSGTTTITFDSADDVPAEGGALKVTYYAKPNSTDIQRFESAIAIRPIKEIKREA